MSSPGIIKTMLDLCGKLELATSIPDKWELTKVFIDLAISNGMLASEKMNNTIKERLSEFFQCSREYAYIKRECAARIVELYNERDDALVMKYYNPMELD